MALTKVFSDSFTDADGVLLTAHTPEQGLGWSILAGSGGTNAQIDWDGSNGTLVQPFYSPSAHSWYVANTTESPSLTQQVEAVYRSSIVRLMLRASNGSAAPNGVIVEFSASGSIVTIRTLSEGVQTQVATKPATTITSGDVCRALIDDSNDVYAWLNDVPIIWDSNGGNPNFNVASAPPSGQVGWIGVKSYTTNGTDSYDAWYDVASGPTTVTSAISAGLPTPSAASTVNVQSTTISFTVAAGLPVPSASSAVTIVPAVGDPIFTSEPLRDNTGTLLVSEALDYVAIYDNTTGALVLRETGLSTNASGVFSVQSALLTSGVTYKVDWKVTSQLSARMPAKAAV